MINPRLCFCESGSVCFLTRDALISRRLRLGRHTRRAPLFAVITAFFRAGAHSAFLLRRLLKREGRVAFRAGFRDGLVPEDHVALRVLRAAVEGFAALRFLDDDLALAT